VVRGLAFYRDRLGLAVTERPSSGWAELAAVPDVRAAVEELRAAGVPIRVEPWERGVCWNAMIADPDGNLVRLHERKDGTAG
jgi:predicted enzyme related to lactoylglutathione lyase